MSFKNPVGKVPSYLTQKETMSAYILYFDLRGKYLVSVNASEKQAKGEYNLL